MNNFDTLFLGTFPASTVAVTVPLMVWPTTDDYVVEAIQNGTLSTQTLSVTAGDPVLIPNAGIYNEQTTVKVRIKLPAGDQTLTNSYFNTSNGQIWFQWTNYPV